MLNLGTVRPGSTIYIPFDTFAGATGASITMTGLAVGDIMIFKNGGTTQRGSTTGFTLLDTDGIDFDGLTGIHGFSIDLSSNATADFYNAGASYFVVISTITIDSQTVSFVAAHFRIGYPDAILDTTIATLSTQTSFTLTTGPAEDDALNGCTVIIHDIASAIQLGMAVIADYTGSTKTVTLVAGVTFTAAAGDNISVLQPALQPTAWGRTLDVSAGGEAGLDWANIGSPTTAQNLSATNIDVDQVVASVSGAVGSVTGAVGSVTGNVGGNVTGSVGSVASGGITATSIAADAIGASELAADAVTEIRSLVSGTSDSGSTTTMVDSARTEADTDYWKGAWILFTSGNISGQCRLITGFDASTDTITFAPATTQAVATQTYEILPASRVDLGQWLGSTPSALISGRVDANTQAMANDVLTAAALAADAVTEIQSGLATAAALATVDDFLDTEIAAIISTLGTPAGASISADILTLDNLVDDLESRIGTPSNLGGGATVAANLVDIEAQTDDIGTAGAGLTALATQASVNTIDDFLDTEIAAIITTLGTPAGASVSADIAAIEAQTDDIGVAGAGLTAVPWNAAWDAQVESEVDDALVARFLDKLVIVSGTADSGSTTTMVDAARTEGDNDYWKGRVILFTSGVIAGQCAIIADFVAATDTFTFAPPLTQAVATQTYVILPGISVWDDTLAEHLISGSAGASLNAAGSAGDPWNTALPGAYGAGTGGFIVGTNLNATVSSRSSHSAADVWAVATRALTDKAGFSLSAAGVQAIWDALTSALTTANSIGKLLVDNINATISSRASHSAADVWAVATRLLTAGTNIVLAKGTGVTGFNDLSAAQVNTEADTALTDYDAPTHAELVSEINSVQTDIAALNNLSAAQVNTEVDTALADVNLDHLVGTATGIPAIPAGTYIDQIMDDGTAVYDRTTDSLQAVRDRGDAAWTTGSVLTQADVRTAVGLASANLDTQLTTIDDFLDTEVLAIKAKTDQLTFTTANKVDSTIQAAGDFAQGAADKVWSTAARILTAGTNIVLAKGVGVTGFNDVSTAQVNAEVVDALATDTYAEPGQGTPAATATLAAKINYLYKSWRNKKDNDGSTTKLYADDTTTVDQKQTTSEAAGTVTKGEWTTGP